MLPRLELLLAVWYEPDEPRHPLTGIVEGLRRAEGRPLIVLACDLPLVSASWSARWPPRPRRRRRSSRARRAALQPLCARYEPGVLALLEGFYGSAPLIAQVEALAPATYEVEPDVLRNVNEPQDLAAVAALLGSVAGGASRT